MAFKGFLQSFAPAISGWQLSWKGLVDNRNGEWWLLAQLFILLAHLLQPWPKLDSYIFNWIIYSKLIGILLLALGLFESIRSLLSIGSSLSPLPDPKPGTKLITNGAYTKFRHPLYRALIICSLGWCIYLMSLLHLSLLITLGIILKSKAKREETKLRLLFKEYQDYINSTPAIFKEIPWLDWRE